MPPRERLAARGARLARQDMQVVGGELRTARLGTGLTLAEVGRLAGMSAWQVGRMERAALPAVSVEQLAKVGAVVGLDVRVRAYPGPAAARDAGQTALIGRFTAVLGAPLRLRLEVPLPIPGDQRAWDGMVSGFPDGEPMLPTEFDSRLYDFQAQHRRITLKARDSEVEHVVWIIAATRTNRNAIRGAGALVAHAFPVPVRRALAALRAGRHPGGSSLILL